MGGDFQNLVDLLHALREKGSRKPVLDKVIHATETKGAARSMCKATEQLQGKRKNYNLFFISPAREKSITQEFKVQSYLYKQGYYKITGRTKFRDTQIFILGCEISLQAPGSEWMNEKWPKDAQLLTTQLRIDLLGIDMNGVIWVIEVKDPSKRVNRLEGIIEAAAYSMIMRNCGKYLLEEAQKNIPSSCQYKNTIKVAINKAQSMKELDIHGLVLFGRSKRRKNADYNIKELTMLIKRLGSEVVLVRNNITSKKEFYDSYSKQAWKD